MSAQLRNDLPSGVRTQAVLVVSSGDRGMGRVSGADSLRGGQVSWGGLLRKRMRQDVEFSQKVRRTRIAIHDLASQVAGGVCLFGAMLLCAFAVFLLLRAN